MFTAVRDRIRHDPYVVSVDPEVFRASAVARLEANWCVPKAVLYTATLRHAGIPARLAFADVRNHLSSEKLTEAMGTDLFAWHGFTELYLDGRWFKASTALNIGLCRRFGVKVLEFDGTADALLHPYDEAGQRHMEYVRDRGASTTCRSTRSSPPSPRSTRNPCSPPWTSKPTRCSPDGGTT
ncbi:MAG: transglutaminase family protein [Microthrixaceae bacterium]|nr:transglutaminase family protein [Microthrixaceae bacterium]